MAVNLSPVGGVAAQFFDNDGNVLSGGKIYTYVAGTTTPTPTYTTAAGNIFHTNPIILDSAGRVPTGEIWLTDGVLYKFVLRDSGDALIATYDNIAGINSNTVSYTNQQEIITATAGQTVFDLTITYSPGTNSLSVFVDGVNQYGPGAQYAYTETDANTVTFNSGLHVGAEVKFTSTQQQGAGAVDASQVSYTPPFTSSVPTNVQAKLAQTVSIKDFGASGVGNETSKIQAAFNALAGSEGTGYGANPAILDLNGLTITFTGDLYVPTNVSLVNGGLSSAADSLIWRNPYLANTGLRAYTEYWPYMTSSNRNVKFSCVTVINVYIGAAFQECTFNGLVFVNSNSLWTEYNSFSRCAFQSNSGIGGSIRFDGNVSGTSAFSTGAGAGTADGSFGYSNFESNSKIDSSAPEVGITVTDGGTLYNAHLGFQGYARLAGPSGAFLYIDSALNVSAVNQCVFEVHLESFGAAANVISLSTNSRFWYNVGSIQSASPEMVMAQDVSVDIRSNNISVIGVVLADSAGAAVFNGPSYMTTLTTDLSKRQWIQPKFAAYAASNQTFNSNTATLMQFATEEFDTGSYYASNRFTPKVAGYYQINARVSYNMTATTTGAWVAIYKNGSAYRYGNQDTPINDCARNVASVVYFNGSTDYVEIYGYVFDNAGAPNTVSGVAETYFNGSFVGY
jgi:hypothetical protein